MCPALHRKPYPSDVSDKEWSQVVSNLTLMTEAAPQREHYLRDLFNALRHVIRYGIAWRAMPNDLPRPGLRSISSGNAGWQRNASRCWRRICVPWRLASGRRRSRRRRSSTVAPCD